MGLFVVTGGSRGIGRSLVARLLQQGHQVIGSARGPAPVTSDRLHWTSLDLADPEQAQLWIGEALRPCPSPDRVHLILNAGMIDPLMPVRDLAASELDRHVRLNLTGAMAVAAGFLQASEGWGVERRILAVSSGAARRGVTHWAAYCAAKAGLDGFIRALAAETEHRGGPVRAVSLAPGVVDTGMQQILRATPAPTQARFLELHATGGLADADETAQAMLDYLMADDFGAHELDDLREARARND
jgi:benzil reductase ((S)-benzoin forming)